MPVICYSDSQFYFPPLADADEEGLLVIGGSVTPSRVLEAYSKGIFPWYNMDEVPLWWSPDPRFVLFPAELHVSRSMQKVIAKNVFDFRMNTAFEEVIHCLCFCSTAGAGWYMDYTGDEAGLY
jgi:leucyl/phenylalanyl-tRNA--protein transferase